MSWDILPASQLGTVWGPLLGLAAAWLDDKAGGEHGILVTTGRVQLGLRETVDLVERGPRKTRTREVGTSKPRPAEVGLAEVGAAQVGILKISAAEIGPTEIRQYGGRP